MWLSLGLLTALGCTTPRYVGSVGRDGSYANRGFGLLVRTGPLLPRWKALDPGRPDEAPPAHRFVLSEAPLDLNGDGFIELGETRKYAQPTLRLISRTSTTTVIDINVEILGGNASGAPLDAWVIGSLKSSNIKTSTAATDQAVATLSRLEVSGRPARVFEVGAFREGSRRVLRRALIDQSDFLSEEGARRRQVVAVDLWADVMTDSLRADHDTLLKSMVLAARGGRSTTQETW